MGECVWGGGGKKGFGGSARASEIRRKFIWCATSLSAHTIRQ